MAKITLIERTPVTSIASSANIQRYAQAGEQIGNQILQYNQQQEKMKQASINSEIAKANSEANLRFNNRLNEVKNEYANDPTKGEEVFNNELGTISNEISQTLTDGARQQFMQQTFKYENSYKMQSNNWASTQRTANIYNDYEATDKSLNEQSYMAGKSLSEEGLANVLATRTDNLNHYGQIIEPSKIKELNEKSINSDINSFFNGAVRANPTKAAELLNSGRYDKFLTAEQKDVLKDNVLNYTLAEKNKERQLMKKKPYIYAATLGEPANNLDLSSSDELSSSLIDRQTYIDSQKIKNGLEMKFLTPEEEKQFLEIANNPDVDSAVDFMTGIALSSPNTAYNKMAEQIAQEDTVAAAAFSMAGSNQQLAKDMLNGRRMLKDKTVSIALKPADMNNSFLDSYGDSIQDPVVLNQIMEATKSAYAANIYREGADADSESKFKDILSKTIGEPAKINGYKTPTFIKDDGQPLDDGSFRSLYQGGLLSGDGISLDDLKATGQDNLLLPQQLETYKDHGRLLPVGDGQYTILLTNTNNFVYNTNNEPYVLNLKSIYNYKTEKEQNKVRELFL